MLNHIEEGDVVLADCGFLVEDVIKDKGAHVNISAFNKGKTQLHPYELESTRDTGNVRIHVERIIYVDEDVIYLKIFFLS